MAAMTPAVFLPRLLGCFLTGALLGPGMDLLRPIHRRLPRLTELLLCGLLLYLPLGLLCAILERKK